jgi:colanic acid biosynthesis protein WcaH
VNGEFFEHTAGVCPSPVPGYHAAMTSPPVLSESVFRQGVEALPLVSVDLCITDEAGNLLLGKRNNAPARHWWFTPGARIRKNEPIAQALARVMRDELALPVECAAQATLMGAWDHFYPDSAFDAAVSTHYVNLPHWLRLTNSQVADLQLPQGPGKQHASWQWLPLFQAARDAATHTYVQIYARWLLERK